MLKRLVVACLVTLLAACGGDRAPTGTDVSVSGTGPADPVGAGDAVVFEMSVRNVGPNPAKDIKINNVLGNQLALTSITCTASGGATCPDEPGLSMDVPKLPTGGRLDFEVTASLLNAAGTSVVNTMSATLTDDFERSNNSATATAAVDTTGNDLGIVMEADATSPSGGTATFTATLTNSSLVAVSNISVNWTATAPFPVGTVTVTCAASSGATCPTTLGTAMTVAELPLGRSLRFTYEVALANSDRGTLAAEVGIAAVDDPSAENNTATASTEVRDARSGDYVAYAADGRSYTLVIDFDAGTYTMSGNAATASRSFAATGSGDYAGTEVRLRTAQDAVIGSHHFDDGVLPYIAVRNFATTANALGASLNLMLRNSGAGTVTRTQAATARVSGNVLQWCQDDFEVVQAASCSVGSLQSYTLTVDGEVFTATPTAANLKAFDFRVARIGSLAVMLAAGPSTSSDTSDTSLQLSIGLPESAGLVDSTVFGPQVDNAGTPDWLQINVTRSTYAAKGETPSSINDTAGLRRDSTNGPVAMLTGNPAPILGDAQVWIMQAYPLVVVVGDLNASPNASGLLQIAVP